MKLTLFETLPKEIDPIKLADQRVHLKGQINLSELPRLSEIILDEKPGEIVIDLSFEVIYRHTPVLLTEIIEEKILLNLPLVSKHADGACPVDLSQWVD